MNDIVYLVGEYMSIVIILLFVLQNLESGSTDLSNLLEQCIQSDKRQMSLPIVLCQNYDLQILNCKSL